MSLTVNFAAQVLTVRYLAKSDYGAFAYAMSIVSLGASLVLLGQGRAVSRFVAMYHERGEHAAMFGTIILAFGVVIGFGAAVCLSTVGLNGILGAHCIDDPLALSLLLLLIALAPLEALDNLFQNLLAVFASPRTIFLRRHVVGPLLKLAAIGVVVLAGAGVHGLALCHLGAGILGTVAYTTLVIRVLKKQGILARLDLRRIRAPIRELLRFSFPVFATDVLAVLMPTLAVVFLEALRGASDVAEFRAVVPVAGLNLIVIQSLKFLFTPTASRLHARGDRSGLDDLFCQSAVWTSVLTFPVFAACFVHADAMTVLLFGERYQAAGGVLALLSLGNYFSAALGHNNYMLQVHGKTRCLVATTFAALVTALGLNFVLVPHWGAIGAATAVSSAILVQNVLNHACLALGTETRPLPWRCVKVYGLIALATSALVVVRTAFDLPHAVSVALLALAGAFLLWHSRAELDVLGTFPQLARVPALRRVFRQEEGQ